jgi:hypothetical protein
MHRATQKEKTLRAFRTYFDLLDTAHWMLVELRGRLECFDLTIGGFRLLEMFYWGGPTSVPGDAEKRACRRQNMDIVITRLEERGRVRRELAALPAVALEASHISRAKWGHWRGGRRIGVVRLTPGRKIRRGRGSEAREDGEGIHASD